MRHWVAGSGGCAGQVPPVVVGLEQLVTVAAAAAATAVAEWPAASAAFAAAVDAAVA